jgi:hypothetical protein
MRCTGGDRADLHGCAIIPCWDGGAACGENTRCIPNQGCQGLQCKTTSDCDCGACFNGYCRPRPGVCDQAQPPAPPP